LICSVPNGQSFKVQVKGTSSKNFVLIQEAFFNAPLQQDLFLIVVLVPPANAISASQFFVLSHADAIREWNSLPDTKKDGTPYASGGSYGGLYWRNIKPYEGKWEKLPR